MKTEHEHSQHLQAVCISAYATRKQKNKNSGLADWLPMLPGKRTKRETEEKKQRSCRLAANADRKRTRREMKTEQEHSRRLAANAARREPDKKW